METLYWLLGFVLPTQLGKYFFFENSYVGGLPIDFLSFKIFGSHLLIVLVGMFWFFRYRVTSLGKKVSILGSVFGLFLFLSSSYLTSFYSLLQWGIVVFFGFLVLKSNGGNILSIKKGLAAAGILQLGLVMYQFVVGKSLGGLAYFLGERLINVTSSNVATIQLFGADRLRPYGTFSHPNSLAGFALVAFWICISNKKNRDWLIRAGSVSWLICLFLSFSRAGIAAFILSLLIVFLRLRLRWVTVGSFVVTFLMFAVSMTTFRTQQKTIDERLLYLRTAGEVVMSKPFFGVGVGNFIPGAFLISKEYANKYSYQPVHNIWMLMFSELGLIGFMTLFFLVSRLSKAWSSEGYLGAMVAILVTGTLDHYWLTLIQNQLLLVMVLCLALRENKKRIWRTVNKLQ